ncbi:MAG: tripartite tricarboxylate transporter permease [Dictyoglomaceae bacterium]|nr:tripartite tricarboxylate transporter permease [Dictyoglomaceae bacterium]
MESLIKTFTIGTPFLFQPLSFLLLLVGVIWGMIFGAIPGLTAAMGISLAIPFTFFLNPKDALILTTGIYVGGVTGGLISAILINMPGTPSSVATTFDGYPMSKKGKSGQALGIGLISSFIGGLASVFVMIILSPILARWALRFGPFEYFSLILMAFIGVMGLLGGNIWKNFVALSLGMVFSCIGADTINGLPRFTFGISELQSGIDILPFLVGLFCISEIFKNIGSRTEVIVPQEAKRIKFRELLPSVRIFVENIYNLIRSWIIGLIIGILPGIGGATSNILAYGVAKSRSKHPEKFGTGIPDGIIASETSNNASIGGAMIPLLSLGIPGDAVTAILIGVFMLHGINPGPLLFRYNQDLVFTVFSAQFWGNIIMLLLGLILMRFFIYSLSFKNKYLLPFITVACVIGAFALNNRIFDIWLMFLFGIIGFFLQKFNFSLVPTVVGFVLTPIMEKNLRMGLTSSRGSFLPIFTRPISLTLLVIALILLVLGIVMSIREKRMEVR